MNFILSLIITLVIVHLLVVIPLVGILAANLQFLFGVILPYAAVLIFLIGMIWRVTDWAKSAVPFRIPTTAGQQKSLPWIKDSKLDNPTTTAGVVGRMLLEILLFRSLFRNTKMEYREGPRVTYEWEKWLWLFAIVFHYAFLVVLLRHLRFFTEPVPGLCSNTGIAGRFCPGRYRASGRLWTARDAAQRGGPPGGRHLSAASPPADPQRSLYFPAGRLLPLIFDPRHCHHRYPDALYLKLDVVAVKQLMIGLVTFKPVVPQGIGVLFYIHLFLVCTLFAYFPFSKLVHLGGIFLSPTRNLANNNRMVRHINPWSYPVKVHTYEAYEDEFREKMIEAGIPVEKE